MLKGALQTVNEWLGQITDLLKTLVVIGIVVGILFDDFFGVINLETQDSQVYLP